jgi:NAD(P)-dependent dehydrogenase (short-subunit alcohol dehydrogenase family)
MKSALVTGAANGIGESVARMAGARGYRVGVMDVDADGAARVAATIPGAVALSGDVRDEDAVEAALDAFGGSPDLVVNNAGIVRFASLMDHTLEDWKLALDINLTGTFIVARAAARRMRDHGGGSIVNLASINAINPGTGIGSYPASKAGVIRLTEQMSIEWAQYGIRVNCVAPGFIDGGMSKAIYANPEIRRIRGGAVPLKRLGTCEDVAEAILWLASDAASYITGQNIAIDGGVINSVIANLPRH